MAWTLEWFRVPSATPSLEDYLRIVRILRQVSRASGISAAPVISDFVPLGAKLQRRYRTPLVFCGKLRAYLCSNIVIGIASTMALKKSELYSSLWASCDELRGGMDASQYKDYVLVLLFIKYVGDKCAGQPFAPITIAAPKHLAHVPCAVGTERILHKNSAGSFGIGGPWRESRLPSIPHAPRCLFSQPFALASISLRVIGGPSKLQRGG